MTLDRFWGKVTKTDSCWLWHGATVRGGYGVVFFDGRMRMAHRVAWEQVNGPVPENKILLHDCDIPRCVNPTHLKIGTQRDNILDAVNKGRMRSQKVTACPQGHPYSPENLINTKAGERKCKICNRMRTRRWLKNQKVKAVIV